MKCISPSGEHRYEPFLTSQGSTRACVHCSQSEPQAPEVPEKAASERTAEEFDAAIAKAQAAAESARARRASSLPPAAGSPAPLGDVFRMTVPPSEAQHAAETYWLERQEREAREAVLARRRQAAARARNVVDRMPPFFQWASFDAPELERRVRRREAIGEAVRAVHEARVVLVGTGGTGKTSLAAAMFRARYIAEGGVCVFEAAWRLASARARTPLGQGEPECVARALSADLLVIDDMGGEKPSPMTAIDDIVFERHWQDRPTWVTTGRSPEEIAARYGDNIARRVFEGVELIDCDGG